MFCRNKNTNCSSMDSDLKGTFSLFRDMLDYNDDNNVDIKDIQDATRDLENAFSRQLDFLRSQVEDAEKSSDSKFKTGE